MEEEITNQTMLRANEGMYLTNGDTYGKTVILPKGENVNDWYQITEEEYNNKQEAAP